ncbi:hypothetical protein DXG03_000694 [Asterophora parasitica]|uniref:Uncharacterized protein n=1 Tax=Asterophora parasitica TaxID=117018 RepID=A0A9P7G4T4_9AGAR|nr:hypothetical protein DXG03_000694 [Asterophora parasitica]
MFTLLSSGSNAHGQLSNGSLEDSHEFFPCSFHGCSPNTVPSNTVRILIIASGANHTLLLLETNGGDGKCERELWGSGDGSAGQLGSAYRDLIAAGASSTVFRPIDLPFKQEGLSGYAIKFVAASWETTYIALSCEGKGDVLISMGADDFGDLGIGGKGKGKETARSFYIVGFAHLTLDGMSLRNATLAFQAVEAGQHHVVVQVNATWKDRTEKCCLIGWGASRHGQLGSHLGKAGKPVPFLLTPTLVPTGESSDPVLSIALGSQHTVLRHASGRVSGFGSNRKGQLQGLENAQHVSQLGCAWNSTYVALDVDQKVPNLHATGSGAHGQLGRRCASISDGHPSLAPVNLPLSSDSFNLYALACGTEHVLAIISQGTAPGSPTEAWGWGWNEHGNLGTGTTEDVFTPVRIWPSSTGNMKESRQVIGIWAGSGTSWIYTRQYF